MYHEKEVHTEPVQVTSISKSTEHSLSDGIQEKSTATDDLLVPHYVTSWIHIIMQVQFSSVLLLSVLWSCTENLSALLPTYKAWPMVFQHRPSRSVWKAKTKKKPKKQQPGGLAATRWAWARQSIVQYGTILYFSSIFPLLWITKKAHTNSYSMETANSNSWSKCKMCTACS